MQESRQRKLGAILSYLSIIISTIVQLLYTPLLIRMLGQSEYGLYSLVASIIGYLTILDLGFGNAIVVYTAKYRAQGKKEKEKKLHGMFKMIFYVIGIITMILGLILFFNVDNIFGNTMTSIELNKMKIMMLILTFNLVITFSFNIYSSIISAYEKFVFQKVLAIINTMLKPIIMIPLLFLGYKSITMCVVITIINLIIAISNYIYCKNKLNINIKYLGFDKIVFKTLFGYSIWIFIGIIVDKINWSIDQFILGAVSGTISVSIYSVASQINILFLNLSTALSSVFLPKMSKLVAIKAKAEQFTNEFIKIGRLQYYIMFLFCSGFILFGKKFIAIWAGRGFEESYYVALFLIVPLVIPLIQNIGLSIMQAMNKYKFKSISTIIMAVFNLIISIILARKYGAVGCAMGTAISLIVCNIIVINIYYHKTIKIDIIKFWKNIFVMTLEFILPVLLIISIMRVVIINDSIISIIVYGLIYTLIFTLYSYFVVMNDYEQDIVNKVLSKLKLRRG